MTVGYETAYNKFELGSTHRFIIDEEENSMKNRLLVRIAAIILTAAMLFTTAACGKNTDTGNRPKASHSPLSVISSVNAADSVNGIIPADTYFNVLTNKSISEDELREIISIEPKTDYTIEKKSSKNFKLIPDSPFEDASLVRVKAMAGSKVAYEWSFETDGKLRVVKSYPVKEAKPESGIEVKFSYYDVENFEDCFSIEPEVNGTFRQNGKSRIFVPDNDLAYGKYTVTVSKDLRTTTGKTLGEDFVFSFFIVDEQNHFSIVNSGYSSNDTFRSDELPKANIRNFPDGEVKVSVYSLDDSRFSELISGSAYPMSDDSFPGNLPEIDSFTVNPSDISEAAGYYLDEYVFTYPATYPVGKYVAVFDAGNGSSDCHIFQVSDFVVYALSLDGSITVWVNDAASGKPAKNCKVTLGEKTLKTDNNGTVTFDIKSDKGLYKNGIVFIGEGEGRFITKLDKLSTWSQNNDYYTDLYVESTLYAPGDTVKVWGCVVPRPGKSMPDKVLLEYEDGNYEQVTPDSNGCFIYSFVSNEHPGDYCRIELYTEKDRNMYYCDSVHYEISRYSLPSSVIEITPDKKAYIIGESAEIKLKVTAFDGTPQKDTELEIRFLNDEYSVTTNSAGKAVLKIDSIGSNYSCHDFFTREGIVAEIVKEGLSSSKSVTVATEYFAEQTVDSENNLTVKTYKTDLSRFNKSQDTEDYDLYDQNNWGIFKGGPVDVDFSLSATEYYTEKIEVGTEYDYLTNSKRVIYKYERKDNVILSGDYSTSNGTVVIPMASYINHDDSWVSARLIYDFDGDYIYEYAEHEYGYEERRTGSGYHISIGGKDSFNVGDNVNATIKDSEGKTVNAVSALFITAAPDKRETFVMGSSSVSFEFAKQYKDNAALIAAFFDGKKVYDAGEIMLCSGYDFNLDVSVSADRKTYAPGDRVTLDISVADSEGNPVSCGGVTNVIDEALFSMTYNNPETNLYKVYYVERIVYVSTWSAELTGDGDEGGGGEGPETPRKDFEDTPYFEILSTGKDGKAKVEFTLPDSVTSWHITVKAMDKDGRNGYKEIVIPATLDFFLYTTGTDTFCFRDDICIGVKTLGSESVAASDSKITARITDAKGKAVGDTLTSHAAVGQYAFFNFGKLTTGKYKVLVSAENGSFKDSVEKEITVVESKITTEVVSEFNLAENPKIDLDTEFNTDICLMDESYSIHNDIICKLSSFRGDKIDAVTARRFAENWVSNGDYIDVCTCSDSYCGYWRDDDYKESGLGKDVELLARQNYVFPCDRDTYYYEKDEYQYLSEEQINDLNREEMIMYYTVLAANNEPVLAVLDSLNNQFNKLTVEEKVWLGLAYAAAGQYEKAYAVHDIITDLMTEDNDGLYYADKDEYTSEHITALNALLAFRINSDNSEKLLSTLLNREFTRFCPAFELMGYVLFYVGEYPGKDVVEIDLGNETITAEFASTERCFLSLSPEKLRKAEFRCKDCRVIARCSYYSSVAKAIENGIEESAVSVNIDENALKKGDVFDITLTINAYDKGNPVNLDFVLPAGIICNDRYTVSNYDGEVSRGEADLDGRSFHINLYGYTSYTVKIPCKALFSGDFVLEKFTATEDENYIHTAEETNITSI